MLEYVNDIVGVNRWMQEQYEDQYVGMAVEHMAQSY